MLFLTVSKTCPLATWVPPGFYGYLTSLVGVWRSKRLCLAVRLISSSWNILGETILGSEDCSRMIGIECKECYGLDRIRSELLVIYVCTPLLGTEGFLGGTSGKEPACQCKRRKRCSFDPWVRKIPWRRAWPPTPVLLPGESPWTEEPGGAQSLGSRMSHGAESSATSDK